MNNLAILVFAFVSTSALAAPAPDLRSSIRITGPATRHSSGNYLVPVRVSVRNGGDDIAGRFKVGVEFSHMSFGGTRVTSFASVRSSDGSVTSDGYHAWTTRALFPGRSFTFEANAWIPKTLPRGTEVQLRVVADTCAGDEFLPYFCRVMESDEHNNRTELYPTRLP